MYCNLNFKKAAFIAVIASSLFTACRRDTSPLSTDDNGGYASDGSRMEWVTDDVISIADAAGATYNSAYIGATTSVTVATDTISSPRTLTIRFGDEDVTCFDGRVRRGTIVVSYTGKYSDSAKVHTISFFNYHVNTHQVMGTIKTVRVDTTVAGNWYYKVQVNDSLDMNPDPKMSEYLVWNGNLVRKWVAGFGTGVSGLAGSGDRNDDVFSISGIATLTRQNGKKFSFGISTPIQIALGCDYARSGVVNIGGYEGTRVLSYGAGACDNTAQITVGPTPYQITLTK
ncbi:MAG: hypothetical protein V4649_10805 [Bacteroidota bacterium]